MFIGGEWILRPPRALGRLPHPKFEKLGGGVKANLFHANN